MLHCGASFAANGQLYTVGFNVNGQLGIGSAKNVEEPTLVDELVSKRVVEAACSYFHTTVVTDSGELYACGCNEYGQLGSSDSDGQLVPRPVGYFSRHPVLAVACGQHFTVASLKGGVVAFGKNDHGQLGIGRTSEPVFHPTRLASPLDKAMVPQLSCGYHHTAVITEDGAVYTFGRNDYGQLGLGHKLHMARPTVVESLSRVRVVQVACGCYHTLVLSDDGKVFPFGRNNHGQLGLETSMDCLSPQLISSLQSKAVVKIAAGFYHSVCLVKTSEGATSSGKGAETLSADLSKMLNNPTRSDVVFVVEDRRFFAHGCILAARCEPLEKMLDGRTKDGLQPEIVIPEYSVRAFACQLTVKLLLSTSYQLCCAFFWMQPDFALELHGLADQYLVTNLRSLCENALLRILSVENVVTVMESAHFRSAFTLKKRCARFIVDHYNRICATEAFARLPQALLNEVLLLASHQGVATSNQADAGSG
uniref:BTB domain-containing protein n=1 Tax=Hyaloperonospora arabidopsidis (strain Emoy2) TaxID=559515 RepID=M4B473_HYAAE